MLIGGGAEAIDQYLAAGLVDEVELHVVPILLGGGERLFEGGGPELEREQSARRGTRGNAPQVPRREVSEAATGRRAGRLAAHPSASPKPDRRAGR